MKITYREDFYKDGGGIGKICGQSETAKIDRYVATMAQIERGFLKTKITMMATKTFENRNDAAKWMWEEGSFKQVRSKEHRKELGFEKFAYWFNE